MLRTQREAGRSAPDLAWSPSAPWRSARCGDDINVSFRLLLGDANAHGEDTASFLAQLGLPIPNGQKATIFAETRRKPIPCRRPSCSVRSTATKQAAISCNSAARMGKIPLPAHPYDLSGGTLMGR